MNSITIVGGGSSAWLTAAYFKNNTNYSITIIDKEEDNSVGVGEATTRDFESFLKKCGFDKSEWFKPIDATLKAGIYFPNFSRKNIWHPFLLSLPNKKYNSNLYEALTYNKEKIFTDLPFLDISLKNEVNYKSLENYAYHIDCSKLVSFIKKRLKINFINSEVINIEYDDNLLIDRLELKNGSFIKSDLYIDCTGFQQILGNNKDRVDTTNRLFCDTAVAAHVEYNDKEKELKPYVTSTAVEHGWVWNIPIQSRIGSGLVFNRTITSIEEAKKWLVNYYPDNKVTNIKVIDWTPYYLKQQWKGNVVNIGLSSGFVEPLESSGLRLIMESIELLVKNLKEGSIRSFNNKMVDNYEDVIDFINMHYQYCNIISDFWNYVRGNIISSNKTEHYRNILKTGIKIDDSIGNSIFDNGSWICWMLQCEDIIIENKNIDKTISKKIIDEYNKTYCDKKATQRHSFHVLKASYL